MYYIIEGLLMLTSLILDRAVTPIFDGKSFGRVGQYEMLYYTARGELDPANPLNSGIVNLAKGPRNARGNVEYSMDVSILKPIDLRKGNGLIYYDVLNRGDTKALGPLMNRGPDNNNPCTAADAGDGFLFNLGYTLVWSAWQGGMKSGNGRPLARLPIATEGDRPFVGITRNEFIFEADYTNTGRVLLNPDDRRDITFAESQKIFQGAPNKFYWVLSYPAADLDASKASLTIRHTQQTPRETPADLRWHYVDQHVIEIHRPAGFDAGSVFEFVYPAKDPVIMGMGFATMRDLVSYLRFEASDTDGRQNPLFIDGVPFIRRTIAAGFSQGARTLRDLLYCGFNEDEAHRKVFDGAFVGIGGARKGNNNVAFAQPNLGTRSHETHLVPDDGFPFSYTTVRDPISGREDGILKKYEGADTMPLVIHIDTDSEFWQARSSLMVFDGTKAIPVMDNVRLFLAAGTQHAPQYPPMPGTCKYESNELDYVPFVRALFVALQQWVVDGVSPPDSMFPSVENGTLVSPKGECYRFPTIPGVTYTGRTNPYRMTDHSRQPPEESGPEYPILVPQIDPDGNSIGGIRHPLLEAPLGTHTGWNLREAGQAENELAGMEGSFFPFAKNRQERTARADPRPSLEERYSSKEAYVSIVAAAAQKLVAQRLLLEEDAQNIIRIARQSPTVN
ncbi:alpha/beta hydrolase domain-containing protein [Corticibacterium sp. UT-5YL-CI-8]|nr:alpha/beta hydrolase domain-containing protein [Tianweitania sp. UT-5YL-CI-8]